VEYLDCVNNVAHVGHCNPKVNARHFLHTAHAACTACTSCLLHRCMRYFG
jgi:4-aminobutyrate aminotransferase-like enzyme